MLAHFYSSFKHSFINDLAAITTSFAFGIQTSCKVTPGDGIVLPMYVQNACAYLYLNIYFDIYRYECMSISISLHMCIFWEGHCSHVLAQKTEVALWATSNCAGKRWWKCEELRREDAASYLSPSIFADCYQLIQAPISCPSWKHHWELPSVCGSGIYQLIEDRIFFP